MVMINTSGSTTARRRIADRRTDLFSQRNRTWLRVAMLALLAIRLHLSIRGRAAPCAQCAITSSAAGVVGSMASAPRFPPCTKRGAWVDWPAVCSRVVLTMSARISSSSRGGWFPHDVLARRVASADRIGDRHGFIDH